MSRVIFKRSDVKEFWHLKPGEWCPITSDGKKTAYIGCPKCHLFGCLRGHDISPNGEVNPSVLHNRPDPDTKAELCGFHEYITLERWNTQ